jgi:hypothetical protein
MIPLNPRFSVTSIVGSPEDEFGRIVAELNALTEERDRLICRRAQLVDELVALARRSDARAAERAGSDDEHIAQIRQIAAGRPAAELPAVWRRPRRTSSPADPVRFLNRSSYESGRLAGDPGS